MELNFTELRDLLTTLNETDITELTIKIDNFEMTVRKEAAPLASAALPAQLIASMEGVAFSSSSYPTKSDPAPSPVPTPGTSFSTPAPAPLSNERLVDITSPMVGTFYRAPGPDESPFVEIGDRVRSGQTVCIIEAMKLMNEIEAEVVGEIVEILVQNAQPVEYGQVLMRVKPN